MGQPGVGDIAVIGEADLLHHPARSRVVGQRERHQLHQVEVLKPRSHGGPGQLGGQTLPPAFGDDRPGELHRPPAGSIGVLEASATDELPGGAVAQQPQPEAVVLPQVQLTSETVLNIGLRGRIGERPERRVDAWVQPEAGEEGLVFGGQTLSDQPGGSATAPR